jgi:hypothetical protein
MRETNHSLTLLHIHSGCSVLHVRLASMFKFTSRAGTSTSRFTYEPQGTDVCDE